MNTFFEGQMVDSESDRYLLTSNRNLLESEKSILREIYQIVCRACRTVKEFQ